MPTSTPAEGDNARDDDDDASLASRFGPGLITGAADDDPSGIATYSQAGAQFRFALVWTLFLTTPLMIGIQMLSARIGFVTRNGLATNIGKICPRWLTVSLVGLLVVANTINIAADVAAMAEAVKLLVGGPQPLYVLAIGAVCIAMQLFFSYERTVRVLKWLTLALFAYVAVVLVVACRGRRRSPSRCAVGLPADAARRPRNTRRWSSPCSARRSAPTSSSGRRRRRSRTAGAGRKERACATTLPTCASTCAASSSTRSSAWASRTWSRSASSSPPR